MNNSNNLIPEAGSSVTGCREFDYANGQPNLYRLMCLKQGLILAHEVPEAFDHYLTTVPFTGAGAPVLLPIVSERLFASSCGNFFLETAVAGERFVHPLPKVIGQGNHRPVGCVTRSQYVACLSDARVRGRSAAILVADSIILDFQGDEPSRLDDELEWDPAIFHTDNRHAWYIPPPEDKPPLAVTEAFSLLGAHTDFFGHWMCEYLPKFVAAILSGKLPAALPVLIDAYMPASHRQSLDLLFGNTLEIIEVPAFTEVRVQRLWCAPTLMYMPLHEKHNARFNWDAISASPERFAPVIREMLRRADRALPAPATPAQRIFLARKVSRHRKLVNFGLIEAKAREHDFLIVYPEDHSFAEQASLLRHAHFVIAAEGSAIFLAFFAASGARLLILSHPFTDALSDYNGIFGKQGVDMLVLTGPLTRLNAQTPHDSDYEIDTGEFNRVLEGWLAADADLPG
ncbi:MAG: glycosyltransferase family 61 protein [Methylococcales bacterium]|nr:glycosyltransferase family 61 protein [Methylococcales bacterium]